MVLSHGTGISQKANASPCQIAGARSSTQHLWPWMCMILAVSYVVLGNRLCLFMCLCTDSYALLLFYANANMLRGNKSDDRIICDWRLSGVLQMVSDVQDLHPKQRQNLGPNGPNACFIIRVGLP